jgi:hypothetical protein
LASTSAAPQHYVAVTFAIERWNPERVATTFGRYSVTTGEALMATWMDVMDLAESLREKRDAGHELSGQDAERLLNVLLHFHDRAVAWTPESVSESILDR